MKAVYWHGIGTILILVPTVVLWTEAVRSGIMLLTMLGTLIWILGFMLIGYASRTLNEPEEQKAGE